ncbi:MAG: choice-of-anchor I family protein [Lewinellaceae bacterium]|nr:choice-of-anchor I family protein [Lewinellaceae bacterium]
MTPLYPMLRTLSFLFLAALFSTPLFTQGAREFYQGFEGSANDTWNYTATPARYVADDGDDVWADTTTTSAIQPATGQKFWFMHDLNNPNGGNDSFHILDFEPVDVSGFGFNSVTFKYYSFEYEDSDSIGYILETDTGSGFDMANYVGLNRNTSGWETVFINLPVGVPAVRLRLMAKQNGGNDYAGFDDVLVFSSTQDVISPLVLNAELTGANSVRVNYSEPMDQGSVENSMNYTADVAIGNIVYTDPGTGSSFADITFTEDFTAGQAYTLTVGQVTDVAGNFLLLPFTFEYIYNNTTPSIVITEIFYHPPSDERQEFVELFNAGDSPAVLGGLQLSGEFRFTFPAGLSLGAGEIFLLAYDEAVAEAFFGEDFMGWGDPNSLGNGGGDIIITNFSGAVIDQVNYNDNDPWPVAADGDGPSLELIASGLDNNDGLNWRATANQVGDTDVFATPGIIAENLTPVISFERAAVAVEEGAGIQPLALVVNNYGSSSPQAVVSVAAASTAVEGVDYVLGSDTITFPANSAGPQFLNVDFPDNDALGGRYLIIEITELINSEQGTNQRLIVLIKDNDIQPPSPPTMSDFNLTHLGSYESGASAAAIAHDPASQRLFVANAGENQLDIIDFSDPSNPGPINSIELSGLFSGRVRSVAVYEGIVAVAMASVIPGNNGSVLFFDTDGALLNMVAVGSLPGMLTFTPDGSKLLVANEGEPSSDYSADPEGSASIIDMAPGVAYVADSDVMTAGFGPYNSDSASLVVQGVRLFGPGASVAQDLEPEYIAVSDDGATAYVVCQENNAVAVIDIETASVAAILPLGYKDWSAEGEGFDASDLAPDVFFANWPVKGMYQPNAIHYFTVGGQGYLITANEGAARVFDTFSEEFRVGDDEVVLDPAAFPNAGYLKDDALLGRLHITTAAGDDDGDGDYDELYTYGGRSFSIWDAATGALVYDSGSGLEVITANDPEFGQLFNADEYFNVPKGRSDDRGPEPKAVTVGRINDIPYAFVGLGGIGGVMVFELSDPAAPRFVQYINTRNLNYPSGDLGLESLILISYEDSPDGRPLLVASHERSGTLAVFELHLNCPIASLPDEVGICQGQAVVLEVAGGYQEINWSTGESGPSVSVDSLGVYTVVAATSWGCVATDTVAIVPNPLPVVGLGADVAACEGEFVMLDAPPGFAAYKWNTGSTAQSVSVTGTGQYSVTVTDADGCENSDTVNVVFNSLPVLDFPQDTMICAEDITEFDPGAGNVFIIDGVTLPAFVVAGFAPNSYSVEAVVANEFGCQQPAVLNFTVDVCVGADDVAGAESIELFPNPASGEVAVRLSHLQQSNYHLQVLSISGQVIREASILPLREEYLVEIGLAALPSGVYLVQLVSGKGVWAKRLIVW